MIVILPAVMDLFVGPIATTAGTNTKRSVKSIMAGAMHCVVVVVDVIIVVIVVVRPNTTTAGTKTRRIVRHIMAVAMHCVDSNS